MSREKKAQIIDELQEVFSKSGIVILTDYRGLSTAEMGTLRRALGKSDVEYRVVKNTLARFAAERADRSGFADLFQGPVAIAFSSGDVVAPAKVLSDYIQTTKSIMSIKGGFLGDRLLTAGDVKTLSALPSREILIAKVLGWMQSPIAALVNCLVTPMRGFMGVLQARIKQLEGE